jgi:hypothetical protein
MVQEGERFGVEQPAGLVRCSSASRVSSFSNWLMKKRPEPMSMVP